ncbi:hypothetical protein FIU94_04105 [Sulfitobacter sp. THAF37]|uniref:hypothetical protein n=1 Tax=Sulfitobacter sp. THAF37 TaxID=2587855 RepID=UPI00126840E4|nr:hypothetical protein [Sulfitobacter sp. THAF37]QFT57999.1 hypothetical protein FIU94_04105 [Sulfitobacter sp. THAF37]
MTPLISMFMVFFVGGPLVFRALTQPAPSRGAMRSVAVFACVSAMFSLGLRFGFAEMLDRDSMMALACVLGLWFAWIGVLALGAQAVRRVDTGPHMRRWSAVLGAGGTTVPWFGLGTAQMLAG